MTTAGRITADKVILVEGKDEVLLLDALIQARYPGAASSVSIESVGGKPNFRPQIKAVRTNAEQAGVQLRAVAIIRDANGSAVDAWRSISDAITSADLQPPEGHAAFSDARPSVGIYILPDGESPGALETLCRRSIEGQPAARCVEQYLACLENEDTLLSRNRDKSFTHAFLASRKKPLARVGESAQQGIWNFNAPAFAPLARFVERLLQID